MNDSQPRRHITDEFAAKLETARANRSMQGERRVVTILFCDVTGSTAMAEQLDPEDWAEIMDDAFDFLIAPVYRYEGVVARLMGDAILAFFGAPIAHEDDPVRAVLAGLGILDSIRPFGEQVKREYGLDFDVRVGIHTGPVVVGEIGSDLQMEYTAMGDAVNLAARMEQTAQPGTVQVSGHTHKLVAPLFDFEELGQVEVKGKRAPLPAYRALGRKKQPGHLRGIEGLYAPLIGRAAEFETLKRAAEEARQGRGQIVCLIGEAGLGKSRLIDELRAEWDKQAGESAWREHRGVSYDANQPYGVFRDHLRRAFGISEEDAPEAARDKIAEAMQDVPPDQRKLTTRAIEVLLAVEVESDKPRLEGEALKRELLEAMSIGWEAVASHAPTVSVFDDLHWADPASVDLLLHLLQLADRLPMLFVCAMRPYRTAPGWRVKLAAETDYPHRYTEINLRPLTEADSESLIDGLLAISKLPASLRRAILDKAEGNPFFVEEVVRTLIDTGVVVRDESGVRWQAGDGFDAAGMAIPDQLQALLTARIDRLEEDIRHTLQLASVIGRSFYRRVLAAIADAATALDQHLNTLQRVELIREAARIPELEYLFRHELTRDAAYSSILRRQRREFHRRVGEAIESLFPDKLEEEAHRLAYHFFEARDDERALKYSALAGDAAARLYANVEAAIHYRRALDIARRGAESDEQIVKLYSQRGRVLELSGDHDAALANYQELESLAGERGNRAMELAALIPQATLHSTPTARLDTERGRALSERGLALARELSDRAGEARVLWNLMLLATFTSEADPAQAVEYGEQALAIAREHGTREQVAYIVHDLVRPTAAAGDFQKAWRLLDEAQHLWRELNNLPMLADSLATVAEGLLYLGDLEASIESARESEEISRRIGNVWGQANALRNVGLIHAERGDAGGAIAAWSASVALGEKAGFLAPGIYDRVQMALVYGRLGSLERGFELVHEALAQPNVPGGRSGLLFPVVTQAWLHLQAGDRDEAVKVLRSIEADLSGLQPDLLASAYVASLVAEIELANDSYDRVQSLVEQVITTLRGMGVRVYLADLLAVKGRALQQSGMMDEGYATLAEARREAEAMGSRRALLPILIRLRQIETERGNLDESAQLRLQAHGIIKYMVDHTPDPELRTSFLGLPEIRETLES